ncbi:MAG: cell division protein ZapA [Muribaculaceae bacterium]|nr:cell division protein ZapA [Muribaculaceae bacterium]
MSQKQEKIIMKLSVGGETFTHTVNFADQNRVRDVEKDVNDLYTKWRKRFPGMTDRTVMAMVAYQFATHYKELMAMYEEASRLASECLGLIEESSAD